MSIFNRTVTILGLLAVLAASLITLLVTIGAVGADILPFGWFQSQLDDAAGATGGGEAAIIAVTAVISAIIVGLLILEAVPLGRRESLFLVNADDQGAVTVDYQSVRMLAERNCLSAHGARSANCNIRNTREGLAIACAATIAPGAIIPDFSDEAKSKIKEAVEAASGLEVSKVNLKARYEPVNVKRLAVS